jgi:hypothetical protein
VQQTARLRRNTAYLESVGAQVVPDRVDATQGADEFRRLFQQEPKHAALVVWGSPCTDHPKDEHGKEAVWGQDSSKGSNVYKAAKFKQLVDEFPESSVVVTCVICAPPLLPNWGDRVLLRAQCCLQRFENADNTIAEYEPRYACGDSRLGPSDKVMAMVACGKYVQPYLNQFFDERGDFMLYKFMAYSAFFNRTNGYNGSSGPVLFFGEEAADLSRCAAQYTIEHFLPNLPPRRGPSPPTYADTLPPVPYPSAAQSSPTPKKSPRKSPQGSRRPKSKRLSPAAL